MYLLSKSFDMSKSFCIFRNTFTEMLSDRNYLRFFCKLYTLYVLSDDVYILMNVETVEMQHVMLWIMPIIGCTGFGPPWE